MSIAVPKGVCTRVREQVSLALDGQLSQFEQRMLEAHLARCSSCAVYSDEVTAFTEQLRSAPPVALQRPIVVRRTRWAAGVRLQAGVAAAVGLVALGLASQFAGSESSPDLAQGHVTEHVSQDQLKYEQALFESLVARREGSSSSVTI
jgi:predicted anti-sigma-YlaC factor YlaD